MPKHEHRRFTLPKMNKNNWNMFNDVQWTATSSKYDVMLSYPTLGLESFAFGNRCSAGALEAPLDQIGHLGNSSKSLGFSGCPKPRLHSDTAVRIVVLPFCLESWRYWSKMQVDHPPRKTTFCHELSSVPQLLQLLVFMEPVKLCQKIWTALPSTGTRKTNINITKQYIHVSFVTGEIQNFLSFCCVVKIHQQLKSNFIFKPSKQHGFIWQLSPVDASLQKKKQVKTFNRMIQQIMYIVVKL